MKECYKFACLMCMILPIYIYNSKVSTLRNFVNFYFLKNKNDIIMNVRYKQKSFLKLLMSV